MNGPDPPKKRHFFGYNWNDTTIESSPIYTHQRIEGKPAGLTLSAKTKQEIKDQRQREVEANRNTNLLEKLAAVFTETITGKLVLVMALFFILQYTIFPAVKFLLGLQQANAQEIWFSIFTVRGSHLEYIWTWVFSVFSHGGTTHLLVNAFVFISFGLALEKEFNKREYIAFFLIAGVLSGLIQAIVFSTMPVDAPILGASGAISAFIGAMTMKDPSTKILFFFIIPMPIWIGICFFIGVSLGLIGLFGLGAFGIAHTAHLTGLFIGLGYGFYKFNPPLPNFEDIVYSH